LGTEELDKAGFPLPTAIRFSGRGDARGIVLLVIDFGGPGDASSFPPEDNVIISRVGVLNNFGSATRRPVGPQESHCSRNSLNRGVVIVSPSGLGDLAAPVGSKVRTKCGPGDEDIKSITSLSKINNTARCTINHFDKSTALVFRPRMI
jgi:hypothetical protein